MLDLEVIVEHTVLIGPDASEVWHGIQGRSQIRRQ